MIVTCLYLFDLIFDIEWNANGITRVLHHCVSYGMFELLEQDSLSSITLHCWWHISVLRIFSISSTGSTCHRSTELFESRLIVEAIRGDFRSDTTSATLFEQTCVALILGSIHVLLLLVNAELTKLIRTEREQILLLRQHQTVIFAEGQLNHAFFEVQKARNSKLPLILFIFLISKVFPQREALAFGGPRHCHPIVGLYLCTMCIEKRHHKRRSIILFDALVLRLLLHHRFQEILRVLSLHAQSILPLLQEDLENE